MESRHDPIMFVPIVHATAESETIANRPTRGFRRHLDQEPKMEQTTMAVTLTRETPSTDEVLARVEEAGARLVDLQFSDIAGGAKALTIPAPCCGRRSSTATASTARR